MPVPWRLSNWTRPRRSSPDRKSVVWGKSVDLGGRRIIKKKKKTKSGRRVARNGENPSVLQLLCSARGDAREPPQQRPERRYSAPRRVLFFFFFSSRRRHTRCLSDWSSDVCSSDLGVLPLPPAAADLPPTSKDS